jgi:hypothetical protein
MVLKGEIFNPLRTEYFYKDLQHSNLCCTDVLKGLTRIPFRNTGTGPANQRLYRYAKWHKKNGTIYGAV